MTLRNRILISLLAGVLATIFLLGGILLLRVNRDFEQYLAIEQELRIANLVQRIESIYQRATPSETELGLLASTQRIYLEVYNQAGERIGVYDGIPDTDAMRGNYVEQKIPVLNTVRQQIGSLQIGYWDHSLLSQSAEDFSRSLLGTILLSMLAAFLFSSFASMYISRRITRPVEEIMQQTEQIRFGDYSMRPDTQGFAAEFDQLTHNINALSDTLESQEAYRKKYAQDIAHELRTPVTALKLHIAAMQDGLREPTEENLRLVTEEVNRLSRMIEMLKASFENHDESTPVLIETVDCKTLGNELSSSLGPLFLQGDVSLLIDIPDDCKIETDRERLRQILYNLLSNAKKAVDQGGTVTLAARPGKKEIIFTVEDDGIGIHASDLPHIFDRFYRADTARNTRQGGTGLGLAIVRAHVQSLGGNIRAESTPGEGSRFIVSLPTSIQ